jgi:hypothetical protein
MEWHGIAWDGLYYESDVCGADVSAFLRRGASGWAGWVGGGWVEMREGI